MNRFLLIISILLIPVTCWSVDGYKNLKFGIKKEAVKKSKLCSFKEDPPSNGDPVETLECSDFKFNNTNTNAYAYFINGKFLRFAFDAQVDQLSSLIAAMSEKYGAPSSGSSDEEFLAVDKYPDRKARILFDKDTITVGVFSDKIGRQWGVVIYSSPEYERLLVKKQKAGMKDSL